MKEIKQQLAHLEAKWEVAEQRDKVQLWIQIRGLARRVGELEELARVERAKREEAEALEASEAEGVESESDTDGAVESDTADSVEGKTGDVVESGLIEGDAGEGDEADNPIAAHRDSGSTYQGKICLLRFVC
jgi:hypothetical protein